MLAMTWEKVENRISDASSFVHSLEIELFSKKSSQSNECIHYTQHIPLHKPCLYSLIFLCRTLNLYNNCDIDLSSVKQLRLISLLVSDGK